jgi:nitrite reductase/ring-hydroxylating ferredoxin subunit
MAEGILEGTVITCPADGTQFDLTTGKNIKGVKGLFGLKPVKGLRQYNIQLEGNSVRIQCL